MIWFIADTHLGHFKSIEYSQRPFESLQEMHEVFFYNWNVNIGKRDLVYILGDLGFGKLEGIISVLNGKKFLISAFGGHDKSARKCAHLFEGIEYLKEIKVGGHHTVLCHYCMRVWPRMHYNSWHLFAHSHGRLDPIGKSWDVGVDNNNYKPLSEDEIIEIMKNRPDNPNLIKRGLS